MEFRSGLTYGRQPLLQTAMLRYKQVIGGSFGARSLPAQEEIEANCGCLVITQITDYLRILQLASLPRHWPRRFFDV